MRFPSIQRVAAQLRRYHLHVDDEGTDVRLQVYEDGSWAIRVGSSDYDLDHGGYWGAGWLPKARFNSRITARDLLEQAKEQRTATEGK